jgi:hypothetical protein
VLVLCFSQITFRADVAYVGLIPSGDLFVCAKDLFLEANGGAGVRAMLPGDQPVWLPLGGLAVGAPGSDPSQSWGLA